jgi:hypothetical protein
MKNKTVSEVIEFLKTLPQHKVVVTPDTEDFQYGFYITETNSFVSISSYEE